MATPLDTSVLEVFTPVFIFLLIFAVVYAVMDKFKLIGDSKLVHLTIAFSISILFLFSTDLVQLLNIITPWFAVFVIAILFLLSIFMFMGVSEKDMTGVVARPEVYWPVLVVGVIIFIVALIQVFGSDLPDADSTDDRTSEGIRAIVHPRLLGAIILLIIASIAIKFISESVVKT